MAKDAGIKVMFAGMEVTSFSPVTKDTCRKSIFCLIRYFTRLDCKVDAVALAAFFPEINPYVKSGDMSRGPGAKS